MTWFPLFAHALNHEFSQHRRPLIYVCTLGTSKQMLNIMWSIQLHMYHSSKYLSVHMINLDCPYMPSSS